MGSGDVEMGIEQGRRVSSKSGKPKKFASGVISGVIGIIYKCNSNGWQRRNIKRRRKLVVNGASQGINVAINVIYKCK